MVTLKPATGPWLALPSASRPPSEQRRNVKQDISVHLLHSSKSQACKLRDFEASAFLWHKNCYGKHLPGPWKKLMFHLCLVIIFQSSFSPPLTRSQPSALHLDLIPWPSFPILPYCWHPGPDPQYLRWSPLNIFFLSPSCVLLSNQPINKLLLKCCHSLGHVSFVLFCFLILRLAVNVLHSLTPLLPPQSSHYYSCVFHLYPSKLYTKLALERGPSRNKGKSPVLGVPLPWAQALTPSLTEHALCGAFF